MTTSNTDPPAPDDLRFDEVPSDPMEEGSICAFCDTPIDDEYFAVGEDIICTPCRRAREAAIAESSGASRLARAGLFGVGAAFLGSLLYFAILYITGYEVGLVAIVVGVMVGKAVSAGSRSKGGLGYQLLAVALTYFAIVFTYVPFLMEAIMEDQAAIEEQGMIDEAAPSTIDAPAPSTVNEAAPTAPGAGSSSTEDDAYPEVTAGEVVFFFAVLLALAAAAPVLAGFENFIGLLIIGFGLYQAWIANRPQEVTGPYQIRAARA